MATTTSEEQWFIAPEIATLWVGSAGLAWESWPVLEAVFGRLLQAGLVQEVVEALRHGGHTLVCPDLPAAAAARLQLEDLCLALELGAARHGRRECVGATVTQRGRYVRQSGGNTFGAVDLRLAPAPGAGIVRYRSALPVDGPISARFLPAIVRGVRRATLTGGPRGYPLVDLEVTLVGGVEHPVDSWPSSFEVAARMAMAQALAASSVLLEPAGTGAELGYRIVADEPG